MRTKAMMDKHLFWQAVEAVSRTFDVSPNAITAEGRTQRMADARKAVCMILYSHGLNRDAIGRLVKRHPATVSYAIQGGNALLSIDKDFKRRYTLAKAMS